MNKGKILNKTMVSIKSIVAFDLETTGLPSMEHNLTKITELSMAACEREHCINQTELPRVINKIVLSVNPFRKISFGASGISGLSNDLLENSKPFDANIVDLIRIFLDRLPKPVCIVAHNGNRFDFPIFRKALIKSNGLFPEDLYCADSLDAFREIFPKDGRIISTFGTEEEDAICLEALEKVEESLSTPPPKPNMQAINEKTPESKIIPRNFINCKIVGIIPDLNNSEVKRQLDLGNSTSIVNGAKIQKTSYPVSYRLQDVYTFLHGKPFPDAHRAENDTLALLSCIVKCNKDFFEYVDKNAKLFNEIKPMS